MNQLREKRTQIQSNRQRKERETYIMKIRQELLHKRQQLELASQIQEILFGAFICLEQQNGPFLNIYRNIQELLQTTLLNKQQYFTYKLSLFLYINLTCCDEVVTYMIQTNPIGQWQRMKHLAKHNNKCSDYIYQRMRVFLQLITSKYNIQQFSTQELQQKDLRTIMNEDTTKQLLIQPFAFDKSESYYQLVCLYISFMPSSHLVPILLSEFANQSLLCENRSVSLTILGRLQCIGQRNKQMQDLYNAFQQRIMQMHNE